MKKLSFLLIALVLLLNVVSPSSLVRGEGASVTESVYGTEIYNLEIGSPIQENILTSVVMKNEEGENISDIRPDQGSRVDIHVTWELPPEHLYGDGSTFAFKLPDKFELASPIPREGEPEPELSGGVGTFRVSSDGWVTFTFNEEINDGTPVTEGTFNVWRKFDISKFSGSTKQEIIFPIKGDSENKIPVHFNSSSPEEIEKSGRPNKGMNASKIDWVVDFNKGEKAIKNAVFKDELPDELEVDKGSIKIFKLIVQLNGEVSIDEELILDESSVRDLDSGNGFAIELGDIDGAYRVEYATTINSTEDKPYKNKVTVSGDDDVVLPIEEAIVPVKYSKPLEKEVVDYDPITQSIIWEIRYNYNEQEIEQPEAWIEDTFTSDSAHSLDEDFSFKVFKMKIDDDGNATEDGLELKKGNHYEVEPNSSGFVLRFNDKITNAYRIQYKTSSIPRIYGEEVEFKNVVEIYDEIKGEKSHNLHQVIFQKSDGVVDFKEKTIEWTLTLNQDKKFMDNVVIVDEFEEEQYLEFLPDSLKFDPVMNEGADYLVSENPTYESGFKITFINPLTEKLTISYKTKFDSTMSVSQYNNKATLGWDEGEVNDRKTIVKSGKASPDRYTVANGKKTGEYDAVTKDITWTIDVNYNLHKIPKAVIRDTWDPIQYAQNFDLASVKVYHLDIVGGANEVKVGEPVEEDQYTIEYTSEDGLNGFEIKFEELINSAYRIIYTTNLKGHPVKAEYENNAILYDAVTDENYFDETFVVKPRHGGEYVTKSGVQGSGANEDFATWKIEINYSQSHIDAGAKLTDLLSANQILVQNSFQLYTTKVNKNGNLEKDKLMDKDAYTLDVEGNKFTLAFNVPLERALILEYQSFINADDEEWISNEAQFNGQSSGTVDKTEQKEIRVYFQGAGGSGNIPKGNLTIVKVDTETKEPLPGAIFGLYDKLGNILIQTVETGEDGKAIIEKIKHKEYMLRELSAPDGYLFDIEYKAGKVIKFDSNNNEFLIENKKGVWDFELTKVDKDDTTLVLPGAHFKLQLKNANGEYEDVPGYEDRVTIFDGTISYEGLQRGGEYRVIETVAPRGYKLNSEPYEFTIDDDQSATKTYTFENEINVGWVELLKTDIVDRSPLAGVVFKLLNMAGQLIASGLTTDEDGKIVVHDLKAGKYQFVEETAHPDYILDQQPYEFEILEDGVLVRVEATNEKIPGSVRLTKIEAGRPAKKLAGAKFRLLDESKNVVLDRDGNKLEGLTTDQNGEIFVPDLRPGIYYFEETAAPRGYTIKTKLTEFEVVKEEETTVTVENRLYVPGGGGGVPPVDPEEPANPDETEEPEQPEEPVDPGETEEPGNPVDPVDPGETEQPNNPDKKIEEETTVDKPVDGKVEVPEGGKVEVIEGPEHGTVEITPDGKWKYTPNEGYEGKDSFKLKITDPNGNVEEVLVEIDIDGVPRGGVDAVKTPGKTLPKTGESSSLPMQLAGLALIGAGLAFLIRQRLHRSKA